MTPVVMGRTILVSAPVHGRLSEIRGAMRTDLGRGVSFSEVIETLLDYFDASMAEEEEP